MSTGRVENGEPVSVRGRGWKPRSKGQVTLHSDPLDVGSFTVDGTGAFETVMRVPADAAPGSHTLEFAGVGADGEPQAVSLPLEVTAAGHLAVVTRGPGVPIGAVFAAIGLLIGGLFVFARRRASAFA